MRKPVFSTGRIFSGLVCPELTNSKKIANFESFLSLLFFRVEL